MSPSLNRKKENSNSDDTQRHSCKQEDESLPPSINNPTLQFSHCNCVPLTHHETDITDVTSIKLRGKNMLLSIWLKIHLDYATSPQGNEFVQDKLILHCLSTFCAAKGHRFHTLLPVKNKYFSICAMNATAWLFIYTVNVTQRGQLKFSFRFQFISFRSNFVRTIKELFNFQVGNAFAVNREIAMQRLQEENAF